MGRNISALDAVARCSTPRSIAPWRSLLGTTPHRRGTRPRSTRPQTTSRRRQDSHECARNAVTGPSCEHGHASTSGTASIRGITRGAQRWLERHPDYPAADELRAPRWTSIAKVGFAATAKSWASRTSRCSGSQTLREFVERLLSVSKVAASATSAGTHSGNGVSTFRCAPELVCSSAIAASCAGGDRSLTRTDAGQTRRCTSVILPFTVGGVGRRAIRPTR